MQQHLARRSDPSTSHLAGQRVLEFSDRHQRMILDALAYQRKLGAEEIASATGLEPYAVRKRLPELERAGLVSTTGKTRRTTSGRQERIWELA